MNKKDLIKRVCEIYHITPKRVYNATGLYLKEGFRVLCGYVINDTYFIDRTSQDIYPVSDISQLDNVDEYDD